MFVGIFQRTDSGIERKLLYRLVDGVVSVDDQKSPIHQNMARRGLRVKDKRLYPKDGTVFMNALVSSFSGSYMWAEEVKEGV